jgi:glycosyltransferase involved in cell wall biosynthesis
VLSEANDLPFTRRKSILVFNFFGGILKRGIPNYVDNLCVALGREGVECKQLRCPTIMRKLPRSLLNVAFVLTEQLVVPLVGIRYDRVIYSSNSVSLAGVFSRKSALIVHDFISCRGRNGSLAARYTRLTQAAYDKGRGDVIYISESTKRIGRTLKRFSRSNTFLFPNSFYNFMAHVSAEQPARSGAVLLCSGWSATKDLAGALQLYLESGLYRTRSLRILGLAGRREVIEKFEQDHSEVRGRIELMPELNDREVVLAYENASWTWVHSKSEGFGRSVAEARICGSLVIASNIPPLRAQADEATFFYRGLDEFRIAVSNCESVSTHCTRRTPKEHEILQAEICRFMNSHESTKDWRGTSNN